MDKNGMCGRGNNTCMHACVEEPHTPHPPGHRAPGRRPPQRLLKALQKQFEAWVRSTEAIAKKHGRGWEVTFRMKQSKRPARHHTPAQLAWALPEPGHGHADLHRTLRKGLKDH